MGEAVSAVTHLVIFFAKPGAIIFLVQAEK
jgi:hypothetical protein